MPKIFVELDVHLIGDKLEIRGILVGVVLCLIGFIIFVVGMINMTPVNAVSNSFLIIIGIFLGIAGFLVLIINAFAGGSIFT